MLILAGCVLVLTMGENGLITKAQEAKKKQIIAEAKENIGMDLLGAEAEAIQKNEILEQEEIKMIISKYGELQQDGDTIILKNNGYQITLSEIYNARTEMGNDSEYKAKIALLEQQIENLKKQLEDMEAIDNNKTLYHVSGSIHDTRSSEISANGSIAMPSIEAKFIGIPGGKLVATVLSNKITLKNNALTLPKGLYTFESFVPQRGATWGAGYKVFDASGNVMVDHTYTGTVEDFAVTNFELEQETDITIYWYRKDSRWYDLIYYTIKTQ